MVNPEQTLPRGCGSVRTMARARPSSSLLAWLVSFSTPLQPRSHPRVLRVASAPARSTSRRAIFFPLHYFSHVRDREGQFFRRYTPRDTEPSAPLIPGPALSRCVLESYWFPSDGGSSSSTSTVVVRSTPVAKVNGDVRFTYFRRRWVTLIALRCVTTRCTRGLPRGGIHDELLIGKIIEISVVMWSDMSLPLLYFIYKNVVCQYNTNSRFVKFFKSILFHGRHIFLRFK